jgi:hypothetical protein
VSDERAQPVITLTFELIAWPGMRGQDPRPAAERAQHVDTSPELLTHRCLL